MTNQDDNNQEIEKVEDVEVETTKKTSDSDDKKQNDEYEKVCYVCHRTESRAGKMINMGNNIYICPDCMQRSFDAIYNSGINYDDMMKMSGMPNMGMFGNMNYQDMDIPENQKIKKKKKVKKMVNRIPKFAIGSAKNNPPPAVG